MIRIFCGIALACALLATGGCGSAPPTFADRVLADGEARIEMASAWRDGQQTAERGEKLVKSGTRLIEKGQADLAEGQALVAEGTALVSEHREAYEVLSRPTGALLSAEAATERADQLRDSARAWKKGESQIVEGHDLIARGNERIAEGDADIREGETLLEMGRRKMQDVEERYSSLPTRSDLVD